MMTCLCWIFGYMRLEIWHKIKIGLSADWCLCTALCTHSGACCNRIGMGHSSPGLKVNVTDSCVKVDGVKCSKNPFQKSGTGNLVFPLDS